MKSDELKGKKKEEKGEERRKNKNERFTYIYIYTVLIKKCMTRNWMVGFGFRYRKHGNPSITRLR